MKIMDGEAEIAVLQEAGAVIIGPGSPNDGRSRLHSCCLGRSDDEGLQHDQLVGCGVEVAAGLGVGLPHRI